MPSRAALSEKQWFPKGSSLTWTLVLWSVFGGFMLMFFNAIYLTMLMKPNYEKPIETAQELRDKGYSIIIEKSSEYYHKNLLETSPDPVYQELNQRAIVAEDAEHFKKLIIEKLNQSNTHALLRGSAPKIDTVKYHKVKENVKGTDPWVVWLANRKWSEREKLERHLLRCQQVHFSAIQFYC